MTKLEYAYVEHVFLTSMAKKGTSFLQKELRQQIHPFKWFQIQFWDATTDITQRYTGKPKGCHS